MSFRVEGCFNSPASPGRRGGGRGREGKFGNSRKGDERYRTKDERLITIAHKFESQDYFVFNPVSLILYLNRTIESFILYLLVSEANGALS